MHQRILDEVYPFGSSLPSEKRLVEAFGVSRITVRRGLDALSMMGFVRRKRGSGTVVTYRRPASPVRVSVYGLLENILKIDIQTDIYLVKCEFVSAPANVSAMLELPPWREVLHLVRRRMKDGRPFSHLTTFILGEIGRDFAHDDPAKVPMLVVFQRSGIVIASAEQSLRATLASADLAEQLQVEVGSPLLQISRVVRGESGAPIQYIVGHYPPDRYEYRMSLMREPDGAQKKGSGLSIESEALPVRV